MPEYNKLKKIMFYINVIDSGGAERVITNLASHFASNGVDVVLVTSFRCPVEYALNEKVRRLSLEEKEIVQSRIKRNSSRIIKLRKICIEEKPDLLVSFMGEPNFRAVLATIGLKTRTIISVRNDPNREYAGRVMRFVGKHILPLADGCVFQTEDAKAWFPKKLQKKSRVIFNAVKNDFYNVNRKPKDNLIINCGRLQEQKNQKLLIDAVSIVNDSYPSELKILGEGNLRKALEKHINDNNMQSCVSLEGQVSNVPEVLGEADIFVLSSDYEGMPNALMEAMAMGLPCISTDCPCGGPKALFEDGRNGILVPVGDKQKMADAIVSLLTDKQKKEQLGMNAKLKAREFSTEVIISEWYDYFVAVFQK